MSYPTLEFDVVKDGFVCKNLAPGLYRLGGEVWHYVEIMSKRGELYPYRAKLIAFSIPDDEAIVEVEEYA